VQVGVVSASIEEKRAVSFAELSLPPVSSSPREVIGEPELYHPAFYHDTSKFARFRCDRTEISEEDDIRFGNLISQDNI
jgi:hypothetical protein